MDWKRGFSSRYYASIVDPVTRRDIGERIEIIGGFVKKTDDDVRESASIEVTSYDTSKEQLIRVWLDARQAGESSHTPLFTGWTTSPTISIDGYRKNQTLECYSVLKTARDVLLDRGWYAPANADAVYIIKDLLRVTGSNVTVEDGVEEQKINLKYAVIAEQNENHLSMADYILSIIGWGIRINGYGNVIIGPKNTNHVAVFDARGNDILEPKLEVSFDWYSCPNVFRAVMDNQVAIAKDENDASPYSIQNRGREIWAEETSCSLKEEETLSAYAYRRLKELQQVSRTVSYDRRFIPDIDVGNCIRLNCPAQEVTGKFLITSQTINLGFNARTSEEVKQVV